MSYINIKFFYIYINIYIYIYTSYKFINTRLKYHTHKFLIYYAYICINKIKSFFFILFYFYKTQILQNLCVCVVCALSSPPHTFFYILFCAAHFWTTKYTYIYIYMILYLNMIRVFKYHMHTSDIVCVVQFTFHEVHD